MRTFRTPRFGMGWAALALLLGIWGCGSARRGEPAMDALEFKDSALVRGQVVFMEHCNQCHPQGEGGLGPALNNKPLPAKAMRFQVREGFGVMPAFSKDHLSEEDLDHLLAYLNRLQAMDAP